MMILVLVLSLIVASVIAASSPPQPPGSVEVKDGLLSWSPAAEDTTHSVQFRSFEKDTWSTLPGCVRIAEDSCNVSALIRKAEHGCVRLRVKSQRGQLQSKAVEACSATEDRCTPQLLLSAVSGSITVHLSRDHLLWKEKADHAQHCVRYWRQDQPKQQACTMTKATLVLQDLHPGQTYCVEVQYLHFSEPEGVPRCPECIEVPQAKSKHTEIVLGIVLPVLALALVSALVYILLYHKKKIKKWLKPEPEPDCLALPLSGASVCSSPTEEHCHKITGYREIDPV